jgi:hypothetical protein
LIELKVRPFKIIVDETKQCFFDKNNLGDTDSKAKRTHKKSSSICFSNKILNKGLFNPIENIVENNKEKKGTCENYSGAAVAGENSREKISKNQKIIKLSKLLESVEIEKSIYKDLILDCKDYQNLQCSFSGDNTIVNKTLTETTPGLPQLSGQNNLESVLINSSLNTEFNFYHQTDTSHCISRDPFVPYLKLIEKRKKNFFNQSIDRSNYNAGNEEMDKQGKIDNIFYKSHEINMKKKLNSTHDKNQQFDSISKDKLIYNRIENKKTSNANKTKQLLNNSDYQKLNQILNFSNEKKKINYQFVQQQQLPIPLQQQQQQPIPLKPYFQITKTSNFTSTGSTPRSMSKKS